MHDLWNGWGWGMGFMWIFGLLFIVVLVWAVSAVTGGTRLPGGRNSAEEELRRRYALGEIDRDEFQQKLADLRRQPS